MTLSAQTTRYKYAGDNSDTTFAVPFEYFNNVAFVKVYLEDDTVDPPTETLLTYTTHYTINTSTDVLTMVTAPTTSQNLLIRLDMTLSQVKDYITNGAFLQEDHEDGLDRIVAMVQTLSEKIGRSLKLNNSSTMTDPTLAELTGKAGCLLIVNSAATGIESGITYASFLASVAAAAASASAASTSASNSASSATSSSNSASSASSSASAASASAAAAAASASSINIASIQAQIDAKQPLDADLTSLAALSSTGLVARTGSATYAERTLTAPAAGISVSNGNGVSGNPTLALANDLSALEALSSTGFSSRTASDTWAQRTFVAPAAGFTIANGDGVSGNPTFSLADDLAALEALSGTSTIYYRSASNTWSAVTIGSGLTFTTGTLASTTSGVSNQASNLTWTETGLGTTTSPKYLYQFTGDVMNVTGYFTCGTTTATPMKINFPAGYTIKSATVGASPTIVGLIHRSVSTIPGTSAGPFPLFYDGSDTASLYCSVTYSSNALVKLNGDTVFSSGNVAWFQFSIAVTAP